MLRSKYFEILQRAVERDKKGCYELAKQLDYEIKADLSGHYWLDRRDGYAELIRSWTATRNFLELEVWFEGWR